MTTNVYSSTPACHVRVFLLFLVFLSTTTLFAVDGSEFVLATPTATVQNRSRTELKEEIGQRIKQATLAATTLLEQVGKFQQGWGKQLSLALKTQASLRQSLQESCALHNACGAICLEVAALQRTYTTAIEKLLENQKPFKKAGKAELNKTLSILINTRQQLERTTRAVICLQTSTPMVGSNRVAAVTKKLEQEQGKVHAYVVSSQQDGCLKLA